jgi:hypothetical protein
LTHVLAEREIQVEPRYQLQNASLAIRDVYDAAEELVTNSDDRYEILGIPGRIEIEVKRQRGDQPELLRVRDFADGMSAEDMDAKLSRRGGLVSGLESGKDVRGTNSRGAKDIAILGTVTFESIKNEKYHKCTLQRTKFRPFESKPVTAEWRSALGIPKGSGTVVTIECRSVRMPQHSTLLENLARLVPLREIVANANRTIVVRDLNKEREDPVTLPSTVATERLKETFEIPGYEGATAKLIIKRADRQFTGEKSRFRLGGILVKSRHAVHESTLFDPQLEHDPNAAWFVGRLTCRYIDDLWNDYDQRMLHDRDIPASNPCPVIDPSRKSGLTREHPFVRALFAEVLKRLRPLVEEERRRTENERASIENSATRRRLNKLEQAAAKFIDEERKEDEPNRDPNTSPVSRKLRDDGYSLNPPFRQFVRGETARCWLNVNQVAFPEVEVGTSVQIECLSDEIESDTKTIGLAPHPTIANLLQAVWKVTAVKRTPATVMRVQAGPIRAEAAFEVFENIKEKYAHISAFEFSSKRYKVAANAKKKKITLYCPLSMVRVGTLVDVSCSSARVTISGDRTLVPREDLGIAVCTFFVSAKDPDVVAKLTAKCLQHSAEAEVQTEVPEGAGIKIQIEDVDLGNQRYMWRQNVLEIAAKHPSLRRYLGSESEDFKGQDTRHFRLLIAEIVAEAVCARVVAYREGNFEYEDENPDWNFYYAEYSRLMTAFLPIAHALQVADVE